MWNVLLIVLLVLNTPILVFGSYPCLCSYQLETSVFKSRNHSSTLLGYIYEYDCKPTYPLEDSRNSDFFAIQFEGQIGYIENVPGYLSIDACPGTISSTDEVLETTTLMPVPSPTSTLNLKSTTTANSATKQTTTPTIPTTTIQPTTTPTTTAKPTTIPTTTSQPTTTPTTTAKPTTTTTTTPQPTTTPTTTTKPTTTPTTTAKPTTIPTTTPQPTTTPTTTTKSTTLPTTTLQPTTIPTTTPQPTTTPTTTTKPTTLPTTTLQPSTPQPTTTTTTEKSPLGLCPDGWVLLGLSCYLFQLSERQDPQHARTLCQKEDSHLISINSEEEQNLIKQHLNTSDAYRDILHRYNSDDAQHNTAIWTGGIGQNGHWKWQDPLTGSLAINYTNWNERYPEHHRICQDGWLQYNTSCYILNLNDKTSFEDAKSRCDRNRSHLVFIESGAEQNALVGFLNSFSAYRAGHYNPVWTGGIRLDKNDGWHWINPNTHPVIHMNYTYWDDGQPNRNSRSCVAMVNTENSRWRDYDCNTEAFYYICERSVSNGPVIVG